MIVLIHLGLCWALKLYRGRAIVGGTDETLLLGAVALITSALASLANVLIDPQPIARSVTFGAPLIAVVIMIVARAMWRAAAVRSGIDLTVRPARTVVVGAGEAGPQLIRSMLSPGSPYLPVAFVDDDPWRRHLRLHGVAVHGTIADLERVIEKTDAQCVVIAIPSAHSDLIREVSARCTSAGVEVKVLPSVSELFGGRVSIRDVRDINIADLLGRSAIETDISSIAHFLNGKRVLVTGAGGSIGSELARQIAKWHPAELMMLDRDESGLHGVQLSIHGRALLDSPDVILCDIRDADALNRIFEERRPEVVFHAAALKHLPMLEQYPLEAVKTNVIGTANVLEAARRVDVERFVNISTDKAAEPTSVLGYSKRVAERLTADYAARAEGSYISVRFGNVLGSRGSVLTTFAAQIAQGGPVTVTHPDVTRYFMTVAEAVQLVLQAGAIGTDGEVLILDMGEPVRIDDVARELIRQSGRKIEIVYTGLRDGEKMDEILRSGGEADQRPVHPLISHVRVAEVSARDVLLQLEIVRVDLAVGLLRQLCSVVPTEGDKTQSAAGAA
ncbi:polysaccharide biosynthesis protein [Nocardioides albidus]|uniref:Polysaccharide biosynthesis protein n=2 Tax=Nocardioides albidus TaxID=1517589 RepID=A0A5C4W7S2_9ACTN|nr:polysaccharide biosynthesis protein [Nocardioides albidus]